MATRGFLLIGGYNIIAVMGVEHEKNPGSN